MNTITNFARIFAATEPGTRSVFQKLSNVVSVVRQRRALAQLDCAALNDIGLTRSQAKRESRRFVWDVPANWRA